MESKYSILLCNQILASYQTNITTWLSDGIKVLWFGTKEEVEKLKESFRPFSDAFLLQAYAIDRAVSGVVVLDADIYRKYTGGNLNLVLENLKYLLNTVGPNRVLVRIPIIPGYTGEEEQKRDKAYLEKLGVTRFDLFRYKVRTYGK